MFVNSGINLELSILHFYSDLYNLNNFFNLFIAFYKID
jgi:hypothetical protein